MMLYPAVDELKTKVDSKYTLAILTSKRARDIIDGKPCLTVTENENPLTVATHEVSQELISYSRNIDADEASDVSEAEPADDAQALEAADSLEISAEEAD